MTKIGKRGWFGSWAVALLLLLSLLAACGDTTSTTTSATTAAASSTTAAASTATTAAASATTATATAAASSATTAAAANAAAETALYEAAKKEGKMSWYVGWYNQDVVVEVNNAFSAKYPGIKVEFVRNPSQTIYQKLLQEQQAGLKNVDIFASTDIGHLMELKDGDKLIAYAPTGKDNILDAYRNIDPANFYHAGSLGPVLILYNSTKIKADELPKSWQELFTDKYKDKISTGSAASSGQVGTWALAMQQKYSWDATVVKLNTLNPKLGRSVFDTVPDVVSGERALAIGPMGLTLANKAKGNPVDVIYPTDGTVIAVQPAGILKDAPNPNAAKLFMNFLQTKEYAEILAKNFEAGVHKDVNIKGAKALTDIPTYTPKPEDVRKELPEIIKKWRAVFGA